MKIGGLEEWSFLRWLAKARSMSKKLGKLAKRYARALLGRVQEDAALLGESAVAEKVQVAATSLSNFADVWKKDAELSSLIVNPMFEASQRKQALLEVTKLLQLPQELVRFIELLFERERIAALPEIASTFKELADEVAKIVHVRVTTARAVDSAERVEIERSVATRIVGKPEFSWNVDPALLGGMTIEYLGRVIDGSLSGRLDAFQRRLIG